jgi:hypothetical protein
MSINFIEKIKNRKSVAHAADLSDIKKISADFNKKLDIITKNFNEEIGKLKEDFNKKIGKIINETTIFDLGRDIIFYIFEMIFAGITTYFIDDRNSYKENKKNITRILTKNNLNGFITAHPLFEKYYEDYKKRVNFTKYIWIREDSNNFSFYLRIYREMMFSKHFVDIERDAGKILGNEITFSRYSQSIIFPFDNKNRNDREMIVEFYSPGLKLQITHCCFIDNSISIYLIGMKITIQIIIYELLAKNKDTDIGNDNDNDRHDNDRYVREKIFIGFNPAEGVIVLKSNKQIRRGMEEFLKIYDNLNKYLRDNAAEFVFKENAIMFKYFDLVKIAAESIK